MNHMPVLFLKRALVLALVGLWLPGSAGAETGSNLELARRLNEAFVEVAEKVSPSVVVITVTEKPAPWTPPADGTNGTNGAGAREFWRQFHQQFEDDFPERGEGSGVIIRKDGFILT